MSTQIKEKTKKIHKHIWKYRGSHERTCEAPFPTIESCGKIEIYHTNDCCPDAEGWGQ